MKKRKDQEVVEKVEENVLIETNTNKKSKFKYSSFWIKICACAILVALGIWMIVENDICKQIIITVSGVAVGLLCIARIIYLIRAKNISKRFKLVSLIEICINAVLAVFFIIAGVNFQTNKDTKFYDFLNENYRYFIGVVFYIRGTLHFFACSFFEKKVTMVNFFINLIFITVGTFCIAYKFTVDKLAWVLIALILLSAVYLGIDGIITYQKFNGGNNNGEKVIIKKKNKDDSKVKEVEESIGDREEIPAPIIEPTQDNEQIVS